MFQTRLLPTTAMLLMSFASSAAMAGGIIPDQMNQIIIQGRFAQHEPAFLVVFSAKPLTDKRDRLMTSVPLKTLRDVKNSEDYVAIKLYGKPASNAGRCDYFFGTLHDADCPWNDGTDFRWQDWEKCSPDVWDNICIVALPPQRRSNTNAIGVITNVTVRKGGMMLYDSRAKQSYANKRAVNVAFKPFNMSPQRSKYPLLNLAEHMQQFRNDYYELHKNPILTVAYSDLGQTEKGKYAKRGRNWCNEFSSYVYRQNGLMTPDPNHSDVHWQNMREFFEKNGNVYPIREVATWSNEKKLQLIKPGSYASILIGESTHSIFFTTWIADGRNPITKYVGLSGNNKGMVWAHAPMKLPTAETFKGMTPEQLNDYDQKVYFGVPGDVK